MSAKQHMLPMLPENTNTIAILMSNADHTDIDWDEMANLLSPVKAKNPITPEVAARIESIKKEAAVDWDEMAKLLSPVKAKNSITPEVAARIQNNKRAAESRRACVELGYPLLSAIFTPEAFASNARIVPSSLPDEADLWRKEEQKRQRDLFIRQIEHADHVAKKRKEERLAFLQRQRDGAQTQELFEEIDKEITFLERYMRTRYS
jgi:primosomal protein N'